MRASALLVQNISALLRARGQSQKDLATWCEKTETWASQAINLRRNIQIEDLDRIADFFGLATYQLFQPGITPYTERRSGKERRSGMERRLTHVDRIRALHRRTEPQTDPDEQIAIASAARATERVEADKRIDAEIEARKKAGPLPPRRRSDTRTARKGTR